MTFQVLAFTVDTGVRSSPDPVARRPDDPTGSGEPLARETILVQHCIRAATIRRLCHPALLSSYPVYRVPMAVGVYD
jgi:hypothetical protein